MISKDEVKKLAALARIDMSDEELRELQGDLDRILDYVSQVQKLASENTPQKVGELYNVFRDDKDPEESGLFSETLLAEAPTRAGKYIKVKKVLEQGR